MPDRAPAAPLQYAQPDASRPYLAGDAHGLTRRDVASLALKLVGIYSLLQGMSLVSYMPGLLMHYRAYRAASIAMEMLLLGLGPYALSLGVGIFLLLFADRLAPRLLPEPAPGQADSPPPALVRTSGPELQAVAFSVVGLLLIVWSARSLALAAWNFYAGSRVIVEALERPGWGRYALEAAVECGLGVWLFFGSKRLAGFWQRLRGQGGPSAAGDAGAGRDSARPR
jgi:hypothetical protein